MKRPSCARAAAFTFVQKSVDPPQGHVGKAAGKAGAQPGKTLVESASAIFDTSYLRYVTAGNSKCFSGLCPGLASGPADTILFGSTGSYTRTNGAYPAPRGGRNVWGRARKFNLTKNCGGFCGERWRFAKAGWRSRAGRDAGCDTSMGFCFAKTHSSKMAWMPFLKGESRRLSPAQGIEAEIPQTPQKGARHLFGESRN
jgi:hypothetical protein